jgi:hypothetical protein
MKDIKVIRSKAFQNVPKLGGLVWKQTIWQPWSPRGVACQSMTIQFFE